MIIKEVFIKNFFCYLEENKFYFTKGLNIISGRNASGKSQFFNAFYWAFFEQIYSEDGSASKRKRWASAKNLTIYPEAKLREMAIDEQFTTAVEIIFDANDYNAPAFSTEDNITYIFKREITFKKTARGITSPLPSELRIEYVVDGETVFVNHAEHDMLLDQIFPKSIRKFMWYQGETMEELYDFSHDSTLKTAINDISYFPKYDFMDKVVKASDISINKKIQKELMTQNKLSKEQNAVYADITYLEKVIDGKEEQRLTYITDIQFLEEEITRTEHKLEGMDHFIEYKIKLTNLEAEQKYVKAKIDDIDIDTKEKLINVWMLNGGAPLVAAAEKKLQLLNAEMQKRQEHFNPVPMNLPGPEYVEQMIKDKICYICERPVEEDTLPYEALLKRLNDFKENVQIKLLQENYTDLNRYRKKLLNDLPNINIEIAANDRNKNELSRKRNALGKQISNVYADLGSDQRTDLETNANIAQQNVNKLKTCRSDIGIKGKRLQALESEIKQLKLSLLEKKQLRDSFSKTTDTNIVENVAAQYIALFVKSIGALKDYAYKNLLDELETESNRLYSLYLDGREQGVIRFGQGVHVVDELTGLRLIDLNSGEQVAEKLAVANAFLSLSARKMNRSYPLIADAPSSDLDPVNTYNLTVNIGKSFDQIIIMSKDYIQFDKKELQQLIEAAGIETFYQIENEFIETAGGKSRSNRRSVALKIK